MLRRFWAGFLAGCLLLACNQNLVDEVSTGVCASGKRWVGDLTPNEWMFPGHDCVGCHQTYDGPELMAAGTVYGLVDHVEGQPELDGARTTASDCFGVEGASVTITAADGQVLKTHTNEAGNFYFEGRQASLKKPFRVVVEYTSSEGVYSREVMASSPSYGGCARCHNPQEARPTEGAEAGTVLDPDEIVDGVLPIYTGPVHE